MTEDANTTDLAARYLADRDASGLDPVTRAELDALAFMLADTAIWAEPAPDLADRVVRAIESQAGAAPSITAPVAPSASHSATVIPFARRRFARPVVALAGLAAALGVGFTTGRAVRSGGAKPDAVIALGATPLAPGASGTARIRALRSGLEIRLSAPGLPRRDGGRFYEAWLKGDRGLVPIGTFHEGTDVTLWAGVSLTDFPTLTITEEEADGKQESSGRRVLVGRVGGQTHAMRAVPVGGRSDRRALPPHGR